MIEEQEHQVDVFDESALYYCSDWREPKNEWCVPEPVYRQFGDGDVLSHWECEICGAFLGIVENQSDGC